MTEQLITSSVLILAVFLLRALFRKSLSRRVQYALWGLVLLRLLVPFQLPAADFSILTSVQPVQAAVERRLESAGPAAPVVGTVPRPGGGPAQTSDTPAAPGADTAAPAAPAGAAPAPASALSMEELLNLLRRAGAVLTAAWLLFALYFVTAWALAFSFKI